MLKKKLKKNSKLWWSWKKKTLFNACTVCSVKHIDCTVYVLCIFMFFHILYRLFLSGGCLPDFNLLLCGPSTIPPFTVPDNSSSIAFFHLAPNFLLSQTGQLVLCTTWTGHRSMALSGIFLDPARSFFLFWVIHIQIANWKMKILSMSNWCNWYRKNKWSCAWNTISYLLI